jgi:hypothetical protein
MSRLHIFVDGSWFFKVCQANGVLSRTTEDATRPFNVSFSKLNALLLSHACAQNPLCTELGDRYISTSIFALPPDFDDWPNRFPDITDHNIEVTRKNVTARQLVTDNAINDGGYKSDAVYHPPIRDYIIRKLIQRKYQEKQVDASVVALLVRSAITCPSDYHAVLTGDSDILPAIQVAYPQYSQNVFIATTHPDELRAEHRQTSFSLSNFNFAITPLYLQDHTAEILHGNNIYTCANCRKIFVKSSPISATGRPYCRSCTALRT